MGGTSPVAAAVEAAPVVVDLPLKPPPPPKPWLEPQRESRAEPRALSSELPTPALERPARRARGERRAEAGPRFVAAIIDFGIVLLGEFLLLSPVAYYWSKRTPAATDDVHFWPILLSVSFVLFVWGLGVGYFVYYWGIVGQTPGKAAAGIEVRGVDGRYPIGLPTAFARLFGYVVSTALLGIGFVLVLFGRDALHDKIAGTKVVFREKG
jgi:hypothetical protein